MPAQPKPARRSLARAASLGFAAVALLPLVVASLAGRASTWWRRLRRREPRLIWGPQPLISLKYWSQAMRLRGYDSSTCVHEALSINARGDFDFHRGELLGSRCLGLLVGDYVTFGWALLRADVFICFLDGSFLRRTPLWRCEGPLLRLAGKRLVVSPYGYDVAVPGHLGVTEERLIEDYPELLADGDRIRARVDYYSRWADVVVGNFHQLGYRPRADLLWPTQLAIDTDRWPESPPGDGNGRSGEVVVVHAPNHRRVKGTDALLRAIEALRSEGLDVRLELLERRSNEEVRRAILDADVVVDQLVAGYAMFAIEGMSAGKPVLSAMGWLPGDYLEALGDCPIADANLGTVTEVLRALVTDPAERRRLGRAGREFALTRHSLAAAGEGWERIVEAAWEGSPTPELIRPRPATRS